MSDRPSDDENALPESPAADNPTRVEPMPDSLVRALDAITSFPSQREAWDTAESVVRAIQRPEELADLYTRMLDRTDDRAVVSQLAKRAVRFVDEWFGDASRLVPLLERALAVDPEADWAMQRLVITYTSAARWNELLALYDREVDRTANPARQRALLEEAANVARDFARDDARAISALQRLIEIEPDSASTASALERLLADNHRHRDLIALWTRRLERADAPLARTMRVRIACAWFDGLHDASAALEEADRARSTGEPPEELLALFERIGHDPATAAALRRRALVSLRDHFTAVGAETQREHVLTALVDCTEGGERTRVHRDLAERYVRTDRAREAMLQFGAVLTLEPEDADARAGLQQLAQRTGEHETHAAMLVRAAEDNGAGLASARLLAEAAHVHLDARDDRDTARALFIRAFAAADGDADTGVPIARTLLGLLDDATQGAARLDVLERTAALSGDRAMWAEAARLAEQLGETDRALASWRQRLDRDARDGEALDAIVALLERASRWAELATALRARVDASRPAAPAPTASIPPPAGTPSKGKTKKTTGRSKKRTTEPPPAPLTDPRVRRDLVQLASVLFEPLRDIDGAATTWREIVTAYGPDDESDDALAAIARARNDRDELLTVLDAALTRAADPFRRATLLARLGDAHRDDDDTRAAGFYRDALEIDPSSPRARDGLRLLLDAGRAAPASVHALAAAYSATRDHALTLEILEHRVNAATSDAERAGILLESAALHEELGSADEAITLLRRAFQHAPGDDRIEARILDHARSRNAWGAAIDAYRRAADAAGDPALVARLRVRTGIALESANDLPGAYETFAGVLAEHPGDLDAAIGAVRTAATLGHWGDALSALVRTAQALEQVPPALVEAAERGARTASAWQAATSAFERALDTTTLPSRLAAQLETLLALWHRDHRHDRSAAEEALRRAVSHHPDATALSALASLQRAHPDRALFDTLGQLANVDPGDPAVHLEIAHLAIDVLDHASAARPSLERYLDSLLVQLRATPASAFSPADACWALDRIAEIDRANETPADAVAPLRATTAFPISNEGRLVRRHAAELASTALGDRALAIELHRALHTDAPEDRDALASLAALHEAAGQSTEWLAAVEELLALATEPSERLTVRLQIARACDALDDRAGAIARLRENLAEQPGHAATLDALAARFDAESRHNDHVAVLTEQARILEQREPDLAAALWKRAAAVYEDHLGDLDAALSCHQHVIAHRPDAAALDASARIHTARGEHARAALALEQLLPLAAPADLAGYAVRLGRALFAARQRERALESLRRALAIQPSANEVRALLAEYYRTDQAWDALASLLSDGVPHARDDAAGAALLRQAAVIHIERRLEPAAAIPLLERAVTFVPGDPSARVALAGALRSAERLDEAAAQLQLLLQEYGRRRPPERALVHLELARIAGARGQLDAALEQLDLASSMDIVHTGILRTLADMSRDAGQLDRAERAYRTLLMIVRRHDPNRDDGMSEESVGPAEVLFELHRLAEQQDPTRRSREMLEAAFDLAAQSVSESRRLERALRRAKLTELLVRALRARLGRAKDPDTCADALSDLADALDLVPGAEQEALDARLQALANAPRAAALYDKMLAAAKRAGRIEAYVGVLGELADRARDDGETDLAVDVLVRLGEVEAEHAGRLDRAVDALRRAEALGGANHRVLFALERTQSRLGDEAGRIETLRRIADAAPAAIESAHRIDALYRLAEIQLGRDALRADGVRTLTSALEREPQPHRAAALLRATVESAPGDQALVQLFLRAAREAHDDALLLDALERNAALAEADPSLLREAATLAVRVAPDRAEPLLVRAVDAARASERGLASAEWALVALFERARDRGDAETARRWLNDAVRIALDSNADEPHLHALGRLAASPGGDLQLAVEVYEHLRTRNPADRAAWQPLINAYRALGDFDRLERTIKVIADGVFDPAERNGLRIERARLLIDRPDRVDEAISALKYVLGDVPDHDDAATLLRTVYRRAGRTDELLALLRQQLASAWESLDLDRIVELSRELGPILEITDRTQAREIYRTASECVPADRGLVEAQLRLYEADDLSLHRADALERLLALEHGTDAATVAIQIADLREASGDPTKATRALERALRAAPGHADVTARLEAVYRGRNEWAKLAELFERDAESRESPRHAVTRLREAAVIRRDTLHDATAAAATLKRARGLAPADLALLAEYTDALRDAGDAATAIVELGTAIARGIRDPRVHAELLIRRAGMQSAAGRDDAAIADLDKAFVLAADLAAPAFRSLLEARRASAAARNDAVAEGAAVQQLATVIAQSGDTVGAAKVLDSWLVAHPDDRTAWRALGRVHTAASRWADAADVARRRLAIEDGPGLVEAAIDLADVCDKLGQPGDARTGLETVLKAHPREEAVRTRLGAIYEAAGDRRGQATLLLTAADSARDDNERFKLLVRAGDLLLRNAEDPSAAIDPLERAWKIRSTDAEVTALLADAMIALGRLTEADAVLRQAIDAAKGRRTRDLAQVQYRLARIAQNANDPRTALQWLSAALDSDFQNAQIASEVADAAMALGEDEIALKALRAVSLMKNPAPMSKATAFVRQGVIALKQADKKKAVFFARKALLEDPNHAEAQDLIKRAE